MVEAALDLSSSRLSLWVAEAAAWLGTLQTRLPRVVSRGARFSVSYLSIYFGQGFGLLV